MHIKTNARQHYAVMFLLFSGTLTASQASADFGNISAWNESRARISNGCLCMVDSEKKAS